jgi:hypothetical protein
MTANVCSPQDDGWTPLHSAAQEGHVKMAELLIQQGADVGASNIGGWTPLHAASQGGYVNMAQLLIQNGADVWSFNNHGSAPLHLASHSGHILMVELLLQCGAHVGSCDSKDQTPLHLAALQGNVDIIKLLFESGADPNICNDNNKAPLDLAPDNAHLKVESLSQSMTPLVGAPCSTMFSIGPLNRCPNVVQPSGLAPQENLEFSNNEKPSVYTASKNGQIDIVHSFLFFFFFFNPFKCALGCMTLCGTYTNKSYPKPFPA